MLYYVICYINYEIKAAKKSVLIIGDKSQHRDIPDVFDSETWNAVKPTDAVEVVSDTEGDQNVAGLGINYTHSMHPDMAVADRRKATFLTFPYNSVKDAEELSSNGCFYSGT